MAYVSDFTFNGLSGLGNDRACIDQNTIQNSQSCNYTLQNYFAQDCIMKEAKTLAVSQPGINYSGSRGLGIGGCNVDDSSKLLIGGIQTNIKSRSDLFGRTFATVPYLGRGSVDSILESQLRHGEAITSRRTVNRLMEKKYTDYHQQPLLDEISQNLQNPALMIESVASNDWIRGGVPSRKVDLSNNRK